ncbi:hypothetical protein D3C80_1447790 [compost metagenome]
MDLKVEYLMWSKLWGIIISEMEILTHTEISLNNSPEWEPKRVRLLQREAFILQMMPNITKVLMIKSLDQLFIV